MADVLIVCARCTLGNHPSTRFCATCGLPLGSATPDAVAGVDALGPYEAPEPADPDTTRRPPRPGPARRVRGVPVGPRLAGRRPAPARPPPGGLRRLRGDRPRGPLDPLAGLRLRARRTTATPASS